MAREDQNKTPRTGGGDQMKTPRTGGGDHNKTPGGPGRKSAPTEAPATRNIGGIPRNGDPYTPTSVKRDQVVEPAQPPGPDRGSRR